MHLNLFKILTTRMFLRLNKKYSSRVLRREYKTLHDIPGPKPELPFIGTSWTYSIFGYNKDEALTTAKEDFLSKYGPIYKERLRGFHIVHLHNPSHIELVVRAQGKHPMRAVNEANIKWRKSRPDLYNSIGLVDTNGEDWHDIRMKVAPSLLKAGVLAGFTKIFSQIADQFIQNIRSDNIPDGVLDVRHYLYRYGLEAMWHSTLGMKLGALDANPSGVSRDLIPLSTDLFSAFVTLNTSRPWWKLWKTPTYRKFCASEEAIFKIVNRYTQDIIKGVGRGVRFTSDTKTAILLRFLANTEFEVKDINTIIIDFIVAGIPTTAYFLSLLLHRLGQEEVVQKRLHQELDALNLEKNDVLYDDHLKALPYLKAVLQEGYRLTTIIPGIIRLLPQPLQVDDYVIPAFTPILCQIRASSRSATYFTAPLEFIPDRWLSNSGASGGDKEITALQEQAKKNRFLVLPFGFGARMCVGKRLAEKEMIVLLAKIFLNFKIKSEGTLKIGNFFILGPKSSVKIKFMERND